MPMKIELLVSPDCPSCQRAAAIWSQVAALHALPFQTHDIQSDAGEQLLDRFALKTVPAVLIDGVLRGIGVQSPDEAERMIRSPRA